MKKLLTSIHKSEWRLVYWLAFFVVVLSTLPLIYGWLITPSGFKFTGIHFTAPNDWFVYYSYIEQAIQGKVLFFDLFASEPHAPTLNLPWLLVGLVAKFFHLSAPIALNLVRILLIPVLFFVAYLLFSYFLPEKRQRKLAIILFTFSSGLGMFFLNQVIKYSFNFHEGVFRWPMDLWVPEANAFLTMYYSPHFILSLILILLSILFATLAIDRQKIAYSVYAGISACVLFSFHPFHVLSVMGVIAIYYFVLFLTKKSNLWLVIKNYLVIALLAAPAILYYAYLLSFDFVLSQKALQNKTFTTPLWLTLVSYGLLLLFAILGAIFILRKKHFSKSSLLLLVWAIFHFAVIYFPVNYQRRMTAGLQVPLIILSSIFLWSAYDWILKNKVIMPARFLFSQRSAIVIVLAVIFSFSNIFQISSDIIIYHQRRTLSYFSEEFIDAARWLKSVDQNSVIFNSSSRVVNIVPAYSGRTVYVGHGVETPSFSQKQKEIDWFFNHNRDNVIEYNFLKRRNISHIFYGEDEKIIGNYSPDSKPYLKKVYSNNEVSIYSIEKL